MNEIISSIIYTVAVFFALMLPGIILKKTNMIPDGFGKGLSNLILYIAQPALVFLAYVKPYEDEKTIMVNAVYVFVFSIIAHAIFAVVALAVFKKAPDAKARMLKFVTIFANAAFMGIPLIDAVLEDTYPGATMYASIYNITFNLFLWTLGVNICTAKRDINNDGVDDFKEVSSIRKIENDDDIVINGSGSILKAIVHPVTIAAILGLIFFVVPTDKIVLPELGNVAVSFIYDVLTRLSGLVAPLSMVVLGVRLADMNFKGIFNDKLMYVFLALRHIALPLVMVGIIKLVSLVGIDIHPAVSMVIVILAATPAATSATMFAEKFNCDSVYVSRLVALSTIISIATIPLIMLLV